MKILITGCAGFIGFHLSLYLLENTKNKIFGIDNLNNYYDVNLKKERLKILKNNLNFKFSKIDLKNKKSIFKDFKKNKYDIVVNLAAQAGVRFSIKNPQTYFDSNLVGFFNLIEASNFIKIKHFVFASTSSVYGDSKKFPLKETLSTDKPLSFYAATKKCNEVIAYSYSNIFKLKCTGLRFFTVYGPYGRPDMALFKFTKSILENKKLELYNSGNHYRDFTYIDDVVRYIFHIMFIYPKKPVPYKIYNIASGKPKKLKVFLQNIEKNLAQKSKIIKRKFQIGDVYKTHADISSIVSKTNKMYKTKLIDGIEKFINWYKVFYKKK
tara:strand:- start:2017 stop:2988 length:972 start_codon:yes stop_codon:yes gene_type:complete